MDDALEYIEAYFQKQLPEADRKQFEQRCEQDTQFAQDVAFYITTRAAVKQALLEQKMEEWAPLKHQPGTVLTPAPVRKMTVRRWLPYAVAACLLLFVGLYFFNGRSSLNRQVASDVEQELSKLSQTMGDRADSLELGKQLYNKNEYTEALNVFTGLLRSDPKNDDALLYAGYVYLRLKDYDKALALFNELSAHPLHTNRGPYAAALTLLERNREGDKENAGKILHTVVDGKLSGADEAQQLLDLMK